VVSRIPPSGAIEPGDYIVPEAPWTGVPFTVSMPAGWLAENGGQTISKHPDEPNELGFNPFVIDTIYDDACRAEPGLVQVGPTADDLVAALRDQGGPAVSRPEDVTLGGYPAQRLELTVPPDLDLATCRIGEFGLQVWFAGPQDKYLVLLPDGTVSVYVADVGEFRFVLVTQHREPSTPDDVAELAAIIASIELQP
jgi:hypothetical protein